MKARLPIFLLPPIASLAVAFNLHAQDPKLAPLDLKNFKALADKGHFIAQAELQTGIESYLHFRYDRFPSVERIMEQDGSVFARAKGKEWVRSGDWGKTGEAAGKEKSAELDTFATVANAVFLEPKIHDTTQGAMVWRLVDKDEEPGSIAYTYEQSRERPRSDGIYPRYTFIRREGDKDGKLMLSTLTGQLFLGEKLTPYTINFDCTPETVAKAQPEEWIPPAKKIMAGKPVKVEVFATGEANCRVAGILSGMDFDLTIQKPDRSWREIAVGDDSWRSDDDGKTWTKLDEADRHYFYLAHAPINYSPRELIPPFVAVPLLPDEEKGLVHLVFKAPQGIQYEGDRSNYWLTMQDGKPGGVRSFKGPLVFGKSFAMGEVKYGDVADGKGVLPPPGNPAAAPQPGAEAVLMKTLAGMGGQVWKVDAQVEFAKKVRVSGLISGSDYDLAETSADGRPVVRQITIGQESWGSFDGGRTWKPEKADDRALFNLIYAGIAADRMKPPFEQAGTETRGGDTLLHLVEKVQPKPKSDGDVWQYWLLVDKDNNPVGMRRFAGHVMMQDSAVFCDASFAPAGKGEKIQPPPGK